MCRTFSRAESCDMDLPEKVMERAAKIKFLLLDVDGVLTDGRIVLGNYGDELKFFDIQDGHGVVMLGRVGIKTVLLTGRKSRINVKRAKEIGVVKVYQDARDKLKVFEKIIKKFRLNPEEICAVGDDVVDMPVLTRCGLAVAVRNAVSEVKDVAHYVTAKSGGRGAVREVAELLLKSQGQWEKIMERYRR